MRGGLGVRPDVPLLAPAPPAGAAEPPVGAVPPPVRTPGRGAMLARTERAGVKQANMIEIL